MRAPTSTAAQLRHGFGGGRGRSTDSASTAGTRRPQAHFHLPSFVGAPSQGRRHTARQPRAIEPGPSETVPEAAQEMKPPPFEVADIIRAHGNSFIEKNRSWLTWLHLLVLFPIDHSPPSPPARTLILSCH